MAYVENLDIFDLKKNYTFEDLCDKKYINQLSEDELKKFAAMYFVRGHMEPGVIPYEIDDEKWFSLGRVKVDETFKDKYILAYHIGNKQECCEGDRIDTCYAYTKSRWDYSTDEQYFDCGWRYLDHYAPVFSDYTVRIPSGISFVPGTWDFDPTYFMYMYNKFGDEYVRDFLNTRKVYRDYYIARETAKKNEAIRLMKESEPKAYNLEKVQKTTDKFIDSTPIEVVDAYFSREISGKNYVIDVTNFQTLKNEDIPEDRKDIQGCTKLRRIRSHKKVGAIESVCETQRREPITRRIDGEYYRVYPKKNQPVIKHLYEFNDFDFKCDEHHLVGDYDDTADWRGCMYAVFGDEYEEALNKQYDDKLAEWIKEYDDKTQAISEFLSQNCGGMQSVNTNTPLISGETPAGNPTL